MVVVRCLILCSKFVKNRLSAWFTALSRPLDKSWGEGRGKGKRKGRRGAKGEERKSKERGEGKEAGGRERQREGYPPKENPGYTALIPSHKKDKLRKAAMQCLASILTSRFQRQDVVQDFILVTLQDTDNTVMVLAAVTRSG